MTAVEFEDQLRENLQHEIPDMEAAGLPRAIVGRVRRRRLTRAGAFAVLCLSLGAASFAIGSRLADDSSTSGKNVAPAAAGTAEEEQGSKPTRLVAQGTDRGVDWRVYAAKHPDAERAEAVCFGVSVDDSQDADSCFGAPPGPRQDVDVIWMNLAVDGHRIMGGLASPKTSSIYVEDRDGRRQEVELSEVDAEFGCAFFGVVVEMDFEGLLVALDSAGNELQRSVLRPPPDVGEGE